MKSDLVAYWETIERELQRQFNLPPPATWRNADHKRFSIFLEEEVPKKCGDDKRKLVLCGLQKVNGVVGDYRLAAETIRRYFKNKEYPTTGNRADVFAILLGARDRFHFKQIHGLMGDQEYGIHVRQRPEILMGNFTMATKDILRGSRLTDLFVVPPAEGEEDRVAHLWQTLAENCDALEDALSLVRFNQGCRALGDYEVALARHYFERSAELAPHFHEAKLGLGYATMLGQDFQVARTFLLEIPAAHAVYDAALALLSVAAINTGADDESAEYLEELQRRRGGADAGAMNAVGAAEVSKGRFSAAEEVLRRGLQSIGHSVPDSGIALDLMYNLAQALLGQGKTEEAVNLLRDLITREQAATAREPLRLLLSRYLLASVLRNEGRVPESVTVLTKMYQQLREREALRSHPAARSALYELCQHYQVTDDCASAVPVLEFALPAFHDHHGPDHLATATLESQLTFCQRRP